MIQQTFSGIREFYDICIIGGGPVGLSLALALQARGICSILLEAGGISADPHIQQLSDAELLDPKTHDSMRIATCRRLGGTSNLWGGTCVPYDPVDFMGRSNVPANWPIGLAEIAPYYDEACRLVSAGPARFEADGPEIESTPEFSLRSLARWSNAPRFQAAHWRKLSRSRSIDIRTRAVVRNLRTAPEAQIQAVEICRPDGSQSRQLHAGKVVIAAGGVESTRILLNMQRQVPDLFGGAEGALGKYYMGHLVGRIADIRFAHPRLDELFDFQIDEHGTYIRRRLTASAELQKAQGLLNCSFWPVVSNVWEAEHCCATLSAIFLAMACSPIGMRLVPEALRKRHLPPESVRFAPHVWNVLRSPHTAAYHGGRFVWKRYVAASRLPGFYLRNDDLRYGLSFHSEQLPNAQSTIMLSGERDATGLQKVCIDYRFDDKDVDSVLRSHDLLGHWLRANKLGELLYHSPERERSREILAQAKHGAHQIGTTRMGRTRWDGVVDATLKTFDIDNLYVVSSSVLPTSGQANPTLTTIALALRLASHLAECG